VEIEIVVRGFILGFAVAAPVGPIGVLVIRRTVAHGASVGLATGLGAAVADASYAAIASAVAGAAAFAEGVNASSPFRFIGAAVLAWVGLRTLRAAPSASISDAPLGAVTHARAFGSAVGLTATNPATIASFAAAASSIGVGTAGHPGGALGFTTGVLLGSSMWWLALSSGAGGFRTKLGPRALRAVQIGAGALLLGFAIAAVFRR
jgi:threonine/homoserine/homoserine lactone efflux protein